jgi:hypothetical protein
VSWRSTWQRGGDGRTHLLTKGHLSLLTFLTVDEGRSLVVETVQAVGLLVHKVADLISGLPPNTQVTH